MEKLTRFGVSVETLLLQQFDKLISKKGYYNRSEAIRDLIREKLESHSIADEKSIVFGVLSFVYDHHKRIIDTALNKIQHQYHHSILFNTHVHISHDDCLEIIIFNDKASNIKEVSDKILSLKGVKQGKLSLVSPLKNTKINKHKH
jgi:CopG family nickel-responsive transcriptional regulator